MDTLRIFYLRAREHDVEPRIALLYALSRANRRLIASFSKGV